MEDLRLLNDLVGFVLTREGRTTSFTLRRARINGDLGRVAYS